MRGSRVYGMKEGEEGKVIRKLNAYRTRIYRFVVLISMTVTFTIIILISE